jgi:hypothetical protein
VSNLLAAQTGSAAAASVRQPNVVRLEARATLAEEVRQLRPAPLTVCPEQLYARSRRDLNVDGGDIYYQDNSFSCTWISIGGSYLTCKLRRVI